MKRQILSVIFASFVTACGGGGGGGSGEMPDPASLTASSNSVSLSTTENDGLRYRRTAFFTIANPPATGFFLSAFQTTTASRLGMITKVPETFGTYQVEIEFLAGTELIPGIHKETLVFHACVDQACTGEFAGSPQTVEFLYTVTPFGVSALGQNEYTIDVLSIDVLDLAWDAPRNRMYATTSSRSPLAPNSIFTLDPATGAVLSAQFAGSEPDALALSDDGSFLYVGFSGANEFKRYALPEMTLDLAVRLPLPPNSIGGRPEEAMGIDVAPGAPNTVAVSRGTLGLGRQSRGVTIYDDATPRPMTKERSDGFLATTIHWGDDASTLYGGDTESSAHDLIRMTVEASGITSIERIGSFGGGNMHYVDGLVYADTGRITNPQTGSETFLAQSDRIVLDPFLNRIFVLAYIGADRFEIRSHDKTTRSLLDTITFTGFSGSPRRMVRWGSNGLAVSTTNQELVIVRSPIVSGPTPQAALFLHPQSLDVSADAGATGAPPTRLHALTTMPLPGGTHFDFTHTSNGIEGVTMVAGPQQHTMRLNIAFKAPLGLAPGKYRDTIEIQACEDLACTQHLPGSPQTAHVLYTVASPRTISTVGVFTRDLAYDSQARLIYATTQTNSPANPDSLVVVDPATAEFSVALASDKPNALATSADGQFLYVGLDAAGVLQRFQIPGLVPDAQVPLTTEAFPGPYMARRIAVAPDAPTVVAAVLGDADTLLESLVILDEQGARPNRILMHDVNAFENFELVGSLAWGASGSRLYGAYRNLNALAVDANGVSLEVRHAAESGSPFFDRLQYANGKLYSSNGRVYDPETGDILGTFRARGPMFVDVGLNRAFFVGFSNDFGLPFGETLVESFDLSTYLPVERVKLPSGFVRSMVRWGEDGLAVGRSGSDMVLINGPFVDQSPAP